MKHTPAGLPKFERPREITQKQEKKLKNMGSLKWRSYLGKQQPDLSPCVDWNIQAARTGILPDATLMEEKTPPYELGPLYKVRAVQGCQGEMRIITKYWDDEDASDDANSLWKLPPGPNGEHMAAVSNDFHESHCKELLDSQPVPRVRYATETAKNCQIAHHKNNVRRQENDGEWREVNSIWTFTADMTLAKPNEYCATLAENENTGNQYIEIGKIVSIDEEAKTVTATYLEPTANVQTDDVSDLTNAAWYLQRGSHTTTIQNDNVLAYFEKLSARRKLYVALIRKLVERSGLYRDSDSDSE